DTQTEAIGGRRRIGPRHLVGDDRLLHGPGPAAAVLLRPAHAEEAGLVELAVPDAALRERGDRFGGHVLLEPGADLLAIGDVFGSVVEIHGGLSLIEPGQSA